MTAVRFHLLSADRKNCLFPAARLAHCLLTDRRSKCSWLNPEKNGRIKNTNLRAAVKQIGTESVMGVLDREGNVIVPFVYQDLSYVNNQILVGKLLQRHDRR